MSKGTTFRSVADRTGGQLSEEFRLTLWETQGSVLASLLFLVCGNNIWRNSEITTKLFSYDLIIYREIMNDSYIDMYQTDIGRLGAVDGREYDKNKSK